MKTLRSNQAQTVFACVFSLLIIGAFTACSIYQSPQRDTFNANAKANAPTTSSAAAQPTSQGTRPDLGSDWDPCSAITNESLSALFDTPHLDLIRHREANSASCTVVASDSNHMSTWRASCLLRLGSEPALSDAFALFQPAQVSMIHFPNGETLACEAELNAEPHELANGSPQLRAFQNRFNQFVNITVSELMTKAPPQLNLSPRPDLRP